MGKKVNYDEIRKEASQIKNNANNYQHEMLKGGSLGGHSSENKLRSHESSNEKLVGERRGTFFMTLKDQNKKKIGDIMVNYYNNLKKEGDVDKELQMDSS
jgi:hypothetical protein